MKEFWNDRYGAVDFAYGIEANEYFKTQLDKLKPGKILLPAEGEGRNAIFAAKMGWDVFAFDQSKKGKDKAYRLAEENQVSIDFQISEFEDFVFEPKQFDAIALIFAHFPANLKSKYHEIAQSALKKGGILIFEAFSKSHVKYNSLSPDAGGPKNVDMLFSIDEIKSDFKDFDFLEIEEKDIILDEGQFHRGMSSVIRCTARKKV
jgi:cyclopropane fatty-acyl-phospholipid synthase-like methyltransferase